MKSLDEIIKEEEVRKAWEELLEELDLEQIIKDWAENEYYRSLFPYSEIDEKDGLLA